ncbi:carboxymuconolactone decarboxylase family protein [Nesterenkonia haasae]|uniref:carboxymuconolactone decarboxylase family protein n=1 Tax=Nesterenkonia haasae TaxID=2587813 RepID=UPI001F3281D9|nr:carboxymuconolactone decarboxylase family protein [Nesterenkonia haasae]
MVIKDELYDVGIEQRRHMFGQAGAEDQTDNTSGLNDKIQDFVTRYCFGDIWQRPHLSPTERSKVTFAMLVATGKPHETRIHARGALANGVSPVELREIAIHAALYCGIPAAVEGLNALEEIFAEKGVSLDLDGEGSQEEQQ